MIMESLVTILPLDFAMIHRLSLLDTFKVIQRKLNRRPDF